MDDVTRPEPAIRLLDLGISFSGRTVFSSVSCEIAKAGPTVIAGRSGCGKTTLLRTINRLNDGIAGCVVTGEVVAHLGGTGVRVYAGDIPVEELRRRAGMVFQTPNVLPVSVEKNLLLPLRLACGITGGEAIRRLETALREAHLWDEVKDRLRRPAEDLSGGQRQRLCLARILALQPDILLLDEPTASLDYKAAGRIEDLILELSKKFAVVMVSHSLRQTRRLAARILIFREEGGLADIPVETAKNPETFFQVMEEML